MRDVPDTRSARESLAAGEPEMKILRATQVRYAAWRASLRPSARISSSGVT